MNNIEIEEKRLQFIANTAQVSYYPISFKYGKGARIYDADDNSYIDFLSAASSMNIGHGNERIARAVYEQMQSLSQYIFAYFNQEPVVRLAEELCELVGGGEPMKVSFATTGSEAIDGAIKFARGYTGRHKLISMYEAYHGSTYGALSVSALSLNMRRKIGPTLSDVYHFHYPTKDKPWEECIEEMEYAFTKYLPPEEVAAIIVEPIAGDMGLIEPPRKWLLALREICDRYGILLISDEIQLALCRTGKWLCMDNFDVRADIYVLGKSLGGGLPLSAVVAHRDIMDSLEPPAHCFTLAACVSTVVAARENLKLLKEMDANRLSLEKGEYLRKRLYELKEKYDFIGDIRGRGLSIGVDIIDPTTGRPSPDDTTKICYRAIQKGLILIFVNRTTLRIQPPLVIEYDEMDEAIEIMDSAMEELKNGFIPDSVLDEVTGW